MIDGVKILGIDTPKNRKERMKRTTSQVYQRALECDADIYHFHDPELMPLGLRLKRRGKKLYMMSTRTFPARFYRNSGYRLSYVKL